MSVFDFFENLKLKNYQFFVFQFFPGFCFFFLLFKSRNIRERTLVDEYVYTISIWRLEKRLRFAVLNAEKGHLLRYLRGFRQFSDSRILSDLGRSRSVLGLFFALLTKI